MLVGGIFYTGQEKPTGNKHSLREDLLKKFATGEGISGRLPYGLLTKLFTLIGWKRIELNKLFTFDEITETNFESILRRCAIVRIQAKFFEAQDLKKHSPDHETYGVFAREADVKDFLTSSQGAAAGLRIQQIFGEDNSRQDVEDTIHNYTSCGGDLGVTEKYVRLACNLPLPESSAEPSLESKLTSASQDEKVLNENEILDKVAHHYAVEFIRGANMNKMSYLTESVFKMLKLPDKLPENCGTKKKTEWWAQLVRHGHLIEFTPGKYLPR